MSAFDPLDFITTVQSITDSAVETRERQGAIDFANQLRDARHAMAVESAIARAMADSMAAAAAANAAANVTAQAALATSAVVADKTPVTTTASGTDALASLMSVVSPDAAVLATEIIEDDTTLTTTTVTPDYTSPEWYHPYAMLPPRNPLSVETDAASEPPPVETDVPPPTPIQAALPGHQRESYEPDTRIFYRFAKRATAGEIEAQAAALAAAMSRLATPGKQEEPTPVEERQRRSASGRFYPGRPKDNREKGEGEADTLTDAERLQILKDTFSFNSGALCYIAAAAGLRLPVDFMTDPAYLALTGYIAPEAGDKKRDRDEAIRGMATYLRPEKVAERIVDFAISLYRFSSGDGVPVLARRVYSEGILGMVGRAYLQVLGRQTESPSAGSLERACFLIDRSLDDFVHTGPNAELNVAGGQYDRLRHWANAWRISYVDPKNSEMVKVAGNLFRAGPKSRLDAVM